MGPGGGRGGLERHERWHACGRHCRCRCGCAGHGGHCCEAPPHQRGPEEVHGHGGDCRRALQGQLVKWPALHSWLPPERSPGHIVRECLSPPHHTPIKTRQHSPCVVPLLFCVLATRASHFVCFYSS